MSIKEFVDKYGVKYCLSYSTLHRLIRLGVLKENIHYTKSYRAVRCRILINEQKLLQYLKTGREK